MELSFVYLENQNYSINFSKLGYNFNSQFKVSYDANSSVLRIQKNENYIQDFFSFDNSVGSNCIKDVIAIVGQNGTGKSTLLDYLKNELANKVFKPEDVIVLYDTSEHTHLIFHRSGKAIHIDSKSELKYMPCAIDFLDEDFLDVESRGYKDYCHSIDKIQFIFFSNIFDTKVNEKQHGNLINISTNFLSSEDSAYSGFKEGDTLSIHRYREIERQVNFLNKDSLLLKEIPFSIPEKISINFHYIKYNHLQEEYEFLDLLRRIEYDAVKAMKKAETNKEILEIKLSLIILNHLVFEIESFHYNLDEFLKISNNSYSRSQGKFSDKILKILRNNKTEIDKMFPKSLEKDLIDKMNGIKHTEKYMDFYNFILNENFTIKENSDVFSLSLELDLKNVELFKAFDENYANTITTKEYVTYNWRDLSSGEKAYLNIFSRFFSCVNRVKNENVYVLIDEGELYLHPQWQKNFIEILITFLNQLFENKKIRIILTSNSHFIVSDLPSSNVIFLKKDTQGKIKILNGLEENHQTFASNIYDLLTYSFFLENGFMGGFAKRKINALIEMLITQPIEILREKKRDIENTIKIVGDPVIKSKLISMLEDRMKVDLLTIDEKISLLQKQINSLLEARKNS